MDGLPLLHDGHFEVWQLSLKTKEVSPLFSAQCPACDPCQFHLGRVSAWVKVRALFFSFRSCYVCSGETVHHTRGYYMINAHDRLWSQHWCQSASVPFAKSDRRGFTRTALKAACPNEQAEICPLLLTLGGAAPPLTPNSAVTWLHR